MQIKITPNLALIDVFELAEKLDVTPVFAVKAIEHYHRAGSGGEK